MSQEIQPYAPMPIPEPVRPLEPPPAEAEPNPMAPILAALRRRWKLAVLLWVLLAAGGVAGVMLLVKPTYTATAYVEVAPVVQAILYENERPIPMFDAYLKTQAEVIASHQVLTAALADQTIQDIPLVQGLDALSLLRETLSVDSIRGSHLIRLGVTHESRDTAVRLAKAILSAYMARAVGEDAEKQRMTRQILEREREQLRTKLDQISSEIQRLAQAYGTASDTMFELLREGLQEYTIQTKQELERTDLEIFQLEQQIMRLDEGDLTVLQPEDLSEVRHQRIEADPRVTWARQEMEAEDLKLARLESVLPADDPTVAASRSRLEQLTRRLEGERERAAAVVDAELRKRQQDSLADRRARFESALAQAKQRRDVLKLRVEQHDADSIAIGRQGLEIQALREQRELTKQDYDRVIERLRQLEIESQAPTRITVASVPEIRPEGVNDRRIKLGGAAVFGTLVLACALVVGLNWLDPHLRDTQEVESGIGLRLLGAVPSIADLQAGRVNRQDFLECYRLVRATLSGAGPDGRPPKTLLVTSAQAGEGKTSLAISLAISLAEPGNRVLLIDGDMQVPQVGRLLKVSSRHTLKDVLRGACPAEQAVVMTTIPGVHVLIGCSEGVAARGSLTAPTVADFLKDLAGRYDHIVIDSPPSLGAADALVWAQVSDGVIVSTFLGRSDTKAIRLACQRLQSVGARLLGSVIANVSFREVYYSHSVTSQRPNGHANGASGDAHRILPLLDAPQGQPLADASE